jgi:SAM-dependent methyltransferase
MTYERVTVDLRLAYDRDASRRDASEIQQWKVEERLRFLEHLREDGRVTLLEVGAGPGVHARFFAGAGLDVTCTDLSPEHVRLCREKGLKAEVMDFLSLDFGGALFDAVMAMNCLLHVPRRDLSRALTKIRDVLKPGGIFYLGQYGGFDSEGISDETSHQPPRFFSFLGDEAMRAAVTEAFELLEFRSVTVAEPDDPLHYQSFLLRRGATLTPHP